MTYHKRTTCRVCEKSELELFLALGQTPLANSFLKTSDEFISEKFYPLDVYFCTNCSTVQLLDVIDPEVLFRDYIYLSGTSESIAAHNTKYASALVDFLDLSSNDLVIEIGSNDGSLLKCFLSYDVRTLGIEPATNIAKIANENGIETINDFFCFSKAVEIQSAYGPAKVVTANNVLAHVDQTKDFLLGCKELLREDGLIVIEVPYLLELLQRLEYDTIYHEHLCYFSITSLVRLCDEVGLSVVRIDRLPIHGGSIRIYAGKKGNHPSHDDEVIVKVKSEQKAGMSNISYYEHFAENVERNRRVLLDLLKKLKNKGSTLAGYGAPAKGNTLLNYCSINTDIIPFIVDKNPLKVGKYTPGMHIPVLNVSALLERQPDYLLTLAWNFADEIIRQQKKYQELGGKFIIPIPKPEVI